jgi:NDP-sugar pyrophosphorylase family protein
MSGLEQQRALAARSEPEPPCAVALAGGRGVRALPLTLVAPHYLRSKAAMRVAGRTLIEWAVHTLSEQGVRSFHVAANGRENRTQTLEILGDGAGLGVQVRYSRARFDASNTGSGQATLRCLDYWDLDGPVLVFPTDSVFDLDLAAVMRSHEETDAVVTVATVQRSAHEAAEKYGVLAGGPGGQVHRFVEKPDLPTAQRLAHHGLVHTNAGIYLIDGKRLREAGREPRLAAMARSRLDWGADLLPFLVAEGYRVVAHPIRRFGDLGSPRDYLATMRSVLLGEFPALAGTAHIDASSLALRDGVSGLTLAGKLNRGLVHIAPTVRIGRDVEIAPGAVLEDCDIADGVDIGEGSVLRRVACGEHAIVGPGAQVSDCVLGSSALVGSSPASPSVLRQHCVLGDEASVAPGTRLSGVEVFPRLAVRPGAIIPPGTRLTEPGQYARWR